MKRFAEALRGHATHILACSLIALLYAAARHPGVDDVELERIAAPFAFERRELTLLPDETPRSMRPVQGALSHLSGWLNTLGAAVALCDLDADGFPDDCVLVDPRAESVSVRSLHDSVNSYAPFRLVATEGEAQRGATAPMGCVPSDMNEDGLLDVLVYYWGRTPVAFLQRPGFDRGLNAEAFAATELVPGEQAWFTNAATFADVDGDGHADLVVGNYFEDGARVLDTSASDGARMHASMSNAQNGGRNRVLMWSAASSDAIPTVAYEDASDAIADELLTGWTLAVGAADLDGDLLPELYFANDFGPDRLLHNRSAPGSLRFAPLEGRRGWATPKSKVVGRDSFKGMGVDFGDVNGDGILDVYVSNITTEFGLQESQFLFASSGEVHEMRAGIAPYVDESESLGLSRSGWAWDAKLADFDNDGVLEAVQALGFLAGDVDRWPELHEMAMCGDPLLSAPALWHRFAAGDDLSGHEVGPFFVRDADGIFRDVAARVGLHQAEVRRGIALADVDRDGDLDMAVANQWSPSAVYFNESECGLTLELILVLPIDQRPGNPTRVQRGAPVPGIPARAAIGATASMDFGAGSRDEARPRARITFVDGGNGHAGVRDASVRFGLGRASPGPHAVSFAWRDTLGARHRRTFMCEPGLTTIYLGAEVDR